LGRMELKEQASKGPIEPVSRYTPEW
jgi:hypothetical protein